MYTLYSLTLESVCTNMKEMFINKSGIHMIQAEFNILSCYTHESALIYFYLEELPRLVDILVCHTSVSTV